MKIKLTEKQRFYALLTFSCCVGLSVAILPLGVWIGLIIAVLALTYVSHYGI